ncbi:tyrosinase-like [Mantella aurantiaca]
MMKSMFTFALLLLCLADVDGWAFPRECVEGVKEWPVVCCPYYKSSRCGANENRGSCLPVPTSRAEPSPDSLNDERDMFPSYFFNFTCQCKANFMGPSCGECAFSRRGENCAETYTITRRNILSLSPTEREQYLATLHYCKTKVDSEFVILTSGDRFRKRSILFKNGSYYDVMSAIHYFITKPFNSNGREIFVMNAGHGSSGFLTWHRYYLLLVERQFQKCIQNDAFALCYYAWEYDPDCAVCNDNYLGANGYDGRISIYSVFSTWRLACSLDYSQTICAREDCQCEQPRLIRIAGYTNSVKPTLASIIRCLNMTRYDVSPFDSTAQNCFRNCIEGSHNSVHGFFGGTMGAVPTSSNDPVFLHHHANVDKHFEMFVIKQNSTPSSYPTDNQIYGHTATSCITPFIHCVRNRDMMQSIKNFGVKYEGV